MTEKIGKSYRIHHRGLNHLIDSNESYTDGWIEIDLVLGEKCIIVGHPHDFDTDIETMESLTPRYYASKEDDSLEEQVGGKKNRILLLNEVLGIALDRGEKLYFDLKTSTYEKGLNLTTAILDEFDQFLKNKNANTNELQTWIENNIIISGFDCFSLLELRRRFEEKFSKRLQIHATWTSDFKWTKNIDVFNKKIGAILENIPYSGDRNWFEVGVDFCVRNNINYINIPSNALFDISPPHTVEQLIDYAHTRSISIVVFSQSIEERLQLKELGIHSFEYS